MRHNQSSAAGEMLPKVAPEVSPDWKASGELGKGRKLLWVDDSRVLLSLYKAVFEGFGFEVWASSSARDALDHLSRQGADVAILDYEMPELNGAVLASLIKKRHPEMPVILYSASTCIPQDARPCIDAIYEKASPREELLAIIETLSRTVRADESQRCFTPSSNTK